MASPPPATFTSITRDLPIINQHNSTTMWIAISTSIVIIIAALFVLYCYIQGLRQSQRQQQQQHEIHFVQMTAALPRRVYHAAAGDTDECSICLEEYHEEDDLVELPGCCHRYHPQCIESALRVKQECPVCRAQLEG